jgi:hypothetical protein
MPSKLSVLVSRQINRYDFLTASVTVVTKSEDGLSAFSCSHVVSVRMAIAKSLHAGSTTTGEFVRSGKSRHLGMSAAQLPGVKLQIGLIVRFRPNNRLGTWARMAGVTRAKIAATIFPNVIMSPSRLAAGGGIP